MRKIGLGRQQQISQLESEGVDPAIISSMDYQSKWSSIIKLGQVHPLTLGASLTFEFGGEQAIENYSQILTISDYQHNPAVQEAIRNEPILEETGLFLQSICHYVGGGCHRESE